MDYRSLKKFDPRGRRYVKRKRSFFSGWDRDKSRAAGDRMTYANVPETTGAPTEIPKPLPIWHVNRSGEKSPRGSD